MKRSAGARAHSCGSPWAKAAVSILPDAVHLATAEAVGANAVYTYDGKRAAWARTLDMAIGRPE